MIKIVVDSASDFTIEQAKELGFGFVPLQVELDGSLYEDGVSFEKDEYYNLLASTPSFPKTSQPTPGRFLQEFEKAKENNDEVLYIALSSSISGTYQSAVLAASMAEYDRIHIFDSLSGSAIAQIMAKTAKKMADEGKTIDEILKELEYLKEHGRIYIAVKSLDYLEKGGRISKTVKTVGTLAKIKPLLAVVDGKIEMHSKCIGLKSAMKSLCAILNDKPNDNRYPVCVLFSYDRELPNEVAENVGNVEFVQLGATIGSHAGLESFGLAYIEK